MKNKKIKLAVQKNGRLTEESVQFLRASGLIFENYRSKLFSSCRNFPLEIVYVRDDDIPNYVENGAVDIGIVGQNIVNEKRSKVKKLLNLRFGFCSLALAVPKESKVLTAEELEGSTIATSYPNSAKYYFDQKGINVNVTKISGSVEITPLLGIASAIVDLVSTGSTMALNDLRLIEKIGNSEAVLISGKEMEDKNPKTRILDRLLLRFKGVLSAKTYKYVMMNAPDKSLRKIRKIIPGLNLMVTPAIERKGWVSVKTAIKEDVFWDTAEKLKALGAEAILVLPVEKILT